MLGCSLGLLALCDESFFKLLFDGFGLIVFKVASSLLPLGLILLPAMAGLSPGGPVLLGSLDLIFVFHLSSLRDGQVKSLLPLLISLFPFFLLRVLILLVLLPDEVFLGLVPHSLLSALLYRILVLDHCVDLVGLDSRQVVELSPLARVFCGRNILGEIPEVLLG